MVFYIVLRGPLGVGKTTVSELLAKAIGAEPISVDRILDDHGFWEVGHPSEFLRANEVAAARAEEFLRIGTPVIIDGNFYWKPVLEDLLGRLDYPHFVFTLSAPLQVCVERDGGRPNPHGPEAAREVFAKTTAFDFGTALDADRPLGEVVRDIQSRLRLGPGVSGGTSVPGP